MTITLSFTQIVAICTTITAVAAAWKVVSKPVKSLEKKFERYDELFAKDKKRLDKTDELLSRLVQETEMQSDMIYQILDHIATNNNSGGMKEALDKYNALYRHNGGIK